jgi:hypothetical protein
MQLLATDRLQQRQAAFTCRPNDCDSRATHIQRCPINPPGYIRSARQIREVSKKCSKRELAGVQHYYPMSDREVDASTGYELVNAIGDLFAEVTPAMNCCMQVPLTTEG